jgi:Xaa-Pro aminopeptidase
MLDPTHCRARQQRLLRMMYANNLGAVVTGWRSHAYYFTGHWAFWQHEAAFVLFSDGRSALVCAREPDKAAVADEVIAYDSTWFSTHRQEQGALAAERVLASLSARRPRRIGIDTSGVCSAVATAFDGEIVSVDADLHQLRRRKDPDELAIMRRAIDCTRAMYERARQIIEPGVAELTVFSELHQAAVESAGEPLSAYLGNDYACGVPGGPPRNGRAAEAGELYILDLGPAVRGYFADNCRAFAVNRNLTDAQQKAWEIVTGVFPLVEQLARPGTRCQAIFAAVNDYYRSKASREFSHHLGHGVGLQPHEFPHLNPKWDDVLMEGEVFTCEPGLYGPELKGGLRIENQYLVTATGVENLTPFSMQL